MLKLALMRDFVFLLGAAALSSSCHASGSGASPSVSVNTTGRTPLSFVDVGSYASEGADNQGGIAYAEVFMTSKPSACASFQGENTNRQDLAMLSLLVQRNGVPPLPPLATGTYTIGSNFDPDAGIALSAQAQLTVTDATCTSNMDCSASMGAITLNTITKQSIDGTFDLTFDCYGTGPSPMGSHLTGSFSSPQCPDVGIATEAGAVCHP